MAFNGNSSFSTGNSYAMDDRKARTMPWWFRRLVPGWREAR